MKTEDQWLQRQRLVYLPKDEGGPAHPHGITFLFCSMKAAIVGG
jgi:hypothetical protein